MRPLILTLILLFLAPTTPASAAITYCAPNTSPRFVLGFATLRSQVGAPMGDPLECEHANPENGDSLQQTTTGLSFYRKRTNTPTFTDGYTHWALTQGGLVTWVGDSIDPPTSASSIPARPAPSNAPSSPPPPVPIRRIAVSTTDYFPLDTEMPLGFRRSAPDSVTSNEGGEFVSRTYSRNDGSAFGLIAAKAISYEAAQAGCVAAAQQARLSGFQDISSSTRGDDGVLMAGQISKQPAVMVLFRLGVFCGGAVMAGPIIAQGRSDANADAQFKHVLDIMERRASTWPDGYR